MNVSPISFMGKRTKRIIPAAAAATVLPLALTACAGKLPAQPSQDTYTNQAAIVEPVREEPSDYDKFIDRIEKCPEIHRNKTGAVTSYTGLFNNNVVSYLPIYAENPEEGQDYTIPYSKDRGEEIILTNVKYIARREAVIGNQDWEQTDLYLPDDEHNPILRISREKIHDGLNVTRIEDYHNAEMDEAGVFDNKYTGSKYSEFFRGDFNQNSIDKIRGLGEKVVSTLGIEDALDTIESNL